MTTRRLTALVLVATTAYALVRYHVFKDVPWEHLPLYVLNKVLAVAGLVCVGAAPWYRDVEDRKRLGNVGIGLVAGHLLISFAILDPAYFAKFYTTDADGLAKMTWQAETSMLAGVVGAILLGWLFVASLGRPSSTQHGCPSLVPGLGRWILVATAVHVLVMGYRGWWPISQWAEAGYLPPITLLSFLIAAGFVVVRLAAKHRPGRAPAVETLPVHTPETAGTGRSRPR